MSITSERDEIVKAVAVAYGVRTTDIMSRLRSWPIAEARQMAMALLYLRGIPLTRTGQLFDRDHGTVAHAKAAVAHRLTWCKRTKGCWDEVCHLAKATEENLLK